MYKVFFVGILLLLWLLIEEFKVENRIKGKYRFVEELLSKEFYAKSNSIFCGPGEVVCGLADCLQEKKSAVITFRKIIFENYRQR
jgi:hypothetical protein